MIFNLCEWRQFAFFTARATHLTEVTHGNGGRIHLDPWFEGCIVSQLLTVKKAGRVDVGRSVWLGLLTSLKTRKKIADRKWSPSIKSQGLPTSD